jgi:hypothetical protein
MLLMRGSVLGLLLFCVSVTALFDGDIKLTRTLALRAFGEDFVDRYAGDLVELQDDRGGSRGLAGVPLDWLWTEYRNPLGFYEIPYLFAAVNEFGQTSSLASVDQDVVLATMRYLENEVRYVKFVPRNDQGFYLNIGRYEKGCWSYVGMNELPGGQSINLADGCISRRVISHELMHALGFFHEQSRADRDQFVQIKYENIIEEMKINFEIRPTSVDNGSPYDYASLMHYPRTAFTKNGLDTISPNDDAVVIGVATGLSDSDTEQLILFYRCSQYHNRTAEETCSVACPCDTFYGRCGSDEECAVNLRCASGTSRCITNSNSTTPSLRPSHAPTHLPEDALQWNLAVGGLCAGALLLSFLVCFGCNDSPHYY